jgi:hypothetical protein
MPTLWGAHRLILKALHWGHSSKNAQRKLKTNAKTM